MKRLLCLLGLASVMTLAARAQGNDFGMWYEVGAEKKLTKKWTVGAEADFRTRNGSKTADRWTMGLSAAYKICQGLKASAGYTLLYNNNSEKLTFNSGGDPKKWTPSYWGIRHRAYVAVAGSADWGRFSFQLRERWQYTYRPEASDKKYKFDYDADDYLTGYTLQAVKGKGKHLLRSRLQADYNIPHCKVDPFASVEMFNDGSGIQKMRYQAGVDYKLKKRHVLTLTYRFQDVSNDDDDGDANSHLIGLGYKFKF